MPWRLVVFILIFAVFLAFITFNLENKCKISFGFYTTPNEISVFITVFVSFFLGMLSTVPFILFSKKKRRDKEKEKSLREKIQDIDDASPRKRKGASIDDDGNEAG